MALHRPQTYTLSETERFTRTGETACNYRVIEVQAGTYPITWTDIRGQAVDPQRAYYAMIALPGVVVDSSVTNRVLSSSNTVRGSDIGQPATYHIQRYAYTFDDLCPCDSGAKIHADGMCAECYRDTMPYDDPTVTVAS